MLYNFSTQNLSEIVFLEVGLKSDTCFKRKQDNWLWPSSIHPAKTVLATPSLSGKEQLRRSKTIGKKRRFWERGFSDWIMMLRTIDCVQNAYNSVPQTKYHTIQWILMWIAMNFVNTMKIELLYQEYHGKCVQVRFGWNVFHPQHLSFTLRNRVGLCWSNL